MFGFDFNYASDEWDSENIIYKKLFNINPLGIQIDGFPKASPRSQPKFLAGPTQKLANLISFFLKLMGSRTHGSKIDGFPGIHATHANGATDFIGLYKKDKLQAKMQY